MLCLSVCLVFPASVCCLAVEFVGFGVFVLIIAIWGGLFDLFVRIVLFTELCAWRLFAVCLYCWCLFVLIVLWFVDILFELLTYEVVGLDRWLDCLVW